MTVDVTQERWDGKADEVVGVVVRASREIGQPPAMEAVLAELKDPHSDFLNAVVDRLIS